MPKIKDVAKWVTSEHTPIRVGYEVKGIEIRTRYWEYEGQEKVPYAAPLAEVFYSVPMFILMSQEKTGI